MNRTCDNCVHWRQNRPPDTHVFGICTCGDERETSSIFGCADFEQAEWATDCDINWMDVREVVLGKHRQAD